MPDTDKALAELAQKLGVSVDVLWASLLKQQRIEAWILLGALIAGLFLILVIYLFTLAVGDTDDAKGIGLFSLACYIVVAIFTGYWIVTDFMNPAYGALHDIMSMIKR